MRVTKLELFPVPPRWLFLKVSTDEGLSGWGEPVLEGHVGAVAAAVQEAGEYVVGRDPNDIEDIWQMLYRGRFYRGGAVLMSAMAGIDQALWDIKGKIHGVPIFQLLGGPVRQSVRVYAWIGGDHPSNVGTAAKQKATEGYTAIKMNATGHVHYVDSFSKVEEAVARVAEVRDATGVDFGIAVDFHGRVHRAMAKVLAHALEPLRPMFIEEPVLPENIEVLREVAAHTSTPVATGERLYSRWDYKRALQDGFIDIIQPDVSHAGGITEVRKIIAMAEAHDVAAAPHSPLGPIALAASLQLDACSPNVFIQEQSLGIHYNQTADLLDYLVDPGVFVYRDGFVEIPRGPGLGIEVDEERVRHVGGKEGKWRNPVWRHADGVLAEW